MKTVRPLQLAFPRFLWKRMRANWYICPSKMCIRDSLCTLGGHRVLNWALKYFKAGVVSVAMLGEPLGAALWAFLLFGEQPGLTVLLGGLVILAGGVWFAVFEQKEPRCV